MLPFAAVARFALASVLTAPLLLPAANYPDSENRAVSRALQDQPLSFEANQRQAPPDAQFVCRTPSLTVLVKQSGLTFSVRTNPAPHTALQTTPPPQFATSRILEMRFAHARPDSTWTAEEKFPAESNYFLGSAAGNWITGVPHYASVRYHRVYPNIDVAYYGSSRNLEYDLVVAAHGDPGLVRLAFTGIDGIQLSPSGDLLLRTAGQSVRLNHPTAYQVIHGARHLVAVSFVPRGRQIGFRLGSYDPERPLIIDPVLSYSTYLGGTDDEGIFGIGFDREGNLYVAGETSSLDFPARHAVQSKVGGNYDAFVSKFDPSGSRLIYSTYLGGSMYDHAVGIAVDPRGSVYVAGLTNSPDFPVFHALQSKLAGSYDAFVTRLSPSGSQLVYSTYLGGAGFDTASGIAINRRGDAFVVGSTGSLDFPITANALQRVCDQGALPGLCFNDAFVTRLDPAGAKLVYSTYLGGAQYDEAGSVAIDDQDQAWVVGQTSSTNFPVKAAFQPALAGPANAFLTSLNAAGSSIVFSSYLGGNGYDGANAVALDGYRNIYIAGFTSSTNFPTLHPFQAALAGQSDVFVTRVHAGGARLDYSTYLGGTDFDYPLAVAVDALGDASVVGFTFSTDFPVKNALFPKFQGGQADAFVTRLDRSGAALSYSTYLGGSGGDFGYALHTDLTGAAWVGGSTASTDFPVAHAFQPKYAGGPYDAFLSRIRLAPSHSLEVLEAAVYALLQAGAIGQHPGTTLTRHLNRAHAELLAGDTEGAREDLRAFREQALELRDGEESAYSIAPSLARAATDILESLGPAGGTPE
jgi:hypothetical protein